MRTAATTTTREYLTTTIEIIWAAFPPAPRFTHQPTSPPPTKNTTPTTPTLQGAGKLRTPSARAIKNENVSAWHVGKIEENGTSFLVVGGGREGKRGGLGEV